MTVIVRTGNTNTLVVNRDRAINTVVRRATPVRSVDARTVNTVEDRSDTTQIGTTGVQGPRGERGRDAHMQGPPGKDGQIRFTGNGPPPAVIVGAEPGDTYMDLLTGNVYKLT